MGITLLVRLGEAAVGIDCEDSQDAQALQRHFHHCLARPARIPGPPPGVTFRVAHPGIVSWEIYKGEQQIAAPTYRQEVAEVLMQELTACLIDGNQQQAALHAAALARNGRAVIIPALSGSGKSTLAAWLLSHGWDYLTDELTLLEPESGLVRGLPRPLVLKEGTSRLAREWFPADTCTDFPRRQVWIDPPAVVEQALAAWLVFPAYQSGQPFQTSPLSPAEAAFELLRTLVNARHLPGTGLPAMTALARRAPAFRLTYGALDEAAAAWFDRLD